MINKQYERQQRGDNFQEEMRRSWRLLPKCWRMRIADGEGSTRPADSIILLEDRNVLAEYKRTEGDNFSLNLLEPNQSRGLVDFEATKIPHNYGMVFISFLNEGKSIDEAYGFRLIPALEYMKKTKRVSIPLDELRRGVIPIVRLTLVDDVERTYDLKEVLKLCK